MATMTDISSIIADYRSATNEAYTYASCIQCNPMYVTDGSTTYHISEGVCGFAWLEIRPAVNPLVKALKKAGIGRRDEYLKCWTIWVSEFDQSMERKEAYANHLMDALNLLGYKGISVGSRMD